MTECFKCSNVYSTNTKTNMHYTLLVNMRSVYYVLRVTDTHVTVEPETGLREIWLFLDGVFSTLKQWCDITIIKIRKSFVNVNNIDD